VVIAERGVSNEGGDVDGGVRRFECGYVAVNRGISEALACGVEGQGGGWVAFETNGRGADAAVANDDGRDSLGDFGEHVWSIDNTGVVVGVDINETGSEGEPLSFDDVLSTAVEAGVDGGDSTVDDGDVDELCVVADAVEHVCIADEGVAIHAG
jgi:hypothetical protein